MLKFRPSNLTQKRTNINFSELQLVALIEKALNDNSLRGFLYKRSSPNAKWRMKWFLLFENLLFYFDISPQEQQNQHHQQLIQSQSSNLQNNSSSNSKASGFSSLIRRSGHSKHSSSSSTTAKQQQQRVELWPETAEQLRLQLVAGAYDEPRRASAGETLDCSKERANPKIRAPGDQLNQDAVSCQLPDQCRPTSGDHGPKSRQRLQSDPQSHHLHQQQLLGINSSGAVDSIGLGQERPTSGSGSGASAFAHSISGVNNQLAGCRSVGSNSVSRCSSRTLNSSSISGVSSHFLTHNEQTIGRSTTTTAGKTPTQVVSSNYSSLLNRRIGVIFLEGSYCERLVDSPVDFEATNESTHHHHRVVASTSSQQTNSASVTARNSLNIIDHHDSMVVQQQAAEKQQQQQQQPMAKNGDEDSELYCTFTLKWRKEGSKEYQFRTETDTECQTWVHAISNARYSTLLNDKEQLEQKYLHLSQIIESESTAKWQYSRQCEELSTEIKKLRQEICLLKRQESRSNQLRLVLSKSAAIVETILKQQQRRQTQQQQQQQRRTTATSKALAASRNFVSGQHQRQQQQQQSATNHLPVRPASCEPSQLVAAINNNSHTGARDASQSPLSGSLAADEHRRNQLSAYRGYFNGTGSSLQRAKSMDQEQAEQEMSVRRARRFNVASYTRLASLDEMGRSISVSPTALSGSSASRAAATGALAKSLVRAASAATSPVKLQRARMRLIRLSDTTTLNDANNNKGVNLAKGSALSNGIWAGNCTTTTTRDMSSSGAGFSKQQAIANLATTNKRLAATTNEPTTDGLTGGNNDGNNNNSIPSTEPTYNSNDDNNAANDRQMGMDDSKCYTEAGEIMLDDDLVDGIEEEELSIELKSMIEALNSGMLLSDYLFELENSEEIRKIKKVQGFFRGWLCRRRWKQIVQEYIKSPHAESMRKRNNLVFRMVECEEEYVEQLNLLISAFLRPIKMAASSQRPALSHDELNSIFLNSETLLFLHQIFLKGLTARMESWPTLVLGDLFNMLLPMLTIYQEYVRNHHFSLQVLAECKQRDQFSLILHRLEEKPQLNGRTLETFLTYPMHQIPRYIICLHEILAHTPHNHVERRSLYEAQTKLEDLSQGILLQVIEIPSKHSRSTRSRFSSFTVRPSSKQQQQQQQQQQQHHHHHHQGQQSSGGFFTCQIGGDCHNQVTRATSGSACTNSSATYHQHHGHHQPQQQQNESSHSKELVRQCFLFTNHLLLCTRTKDGKLHLLENIGRISLAEVTLIENPAEFIQQQETIISNFELIPRQGTTKPNCGIATASKTTAKNSSCNSISDYHSAYGDFQLARWKSQFARHLSSVTYLETIQLPTQTNQYHSTTTDVAASGGLNNHKRASTSSIPGKWSSPPNAAISSPSKQFAASPKQSPSKRTSFVDSVLDHPGANNELDHNNNSCWKSVTSEANNISFVSNCKGQHRSSSGILSSAAVVEQTTVTTSTSTASTSATITPTKDPLGQPQTMSCLESQQQPTFQSGPTKSSSRSSRITGYLATKLSNLTNLGGSSSNQHNREGVSSSSAPPSPLNKRPVMLNQMFTSSGAGSSSTMFGINGSNASGSKRNSRASSGGLLSSSAVAGCYCCSTGCDSAICLHQPLFSLTKDYGGCDFILLLESTSKIASGGLSGGTNSGSSPGGANVIAGSGGGGTSGSAAGSGGNSGPSSTMGSGITVGQMASGHKDSMATSVSGTGGVSGNSSNHTSGSSLAATGHQQSGLLIIHLVAPNLQEKAAWMSDISQVSFELPTRERVHSFVSFLLVVLDCVVSE